MGYNVHLRGYLTYRLTTWVLWEEIHKAVATETTELPITICLASSVVGFLPGFTYFRPITIGTPNPVLTMVAN